MADIDTTCRWCCKPFSYNPANITHEELGRPGVPYDCAAGYNWCNDPGAADIVLCPYCDHRNCVGVSMS